MSKVLIELEKPKSCKECQFSVTEWTTGTTNCMLKECIFSKEVKAIPIEWIEKYMKHLGNTKQYGSLEEISYMLEEWEWEKENELG